MLKSVTRPCPICDNPTGEILHTQRFVLPEGHPQTTAYDVVCCIKCGFVYADTSSSQKDYNEYYSKLSIYADNQTSTSLGTSQCVTERMQRVALAVAHVIPNKHARIVDIGCVHGGLLRDLHNLGYTNLCGIDLDSSCVAQTAQVPGVDAYIGSLSQIPAEAGPFDCLTSSYVFEHLRDLQPALIYLKQFLKPNACIYLEVPDATRYADFMFAPFQDFNTEHINHFSMISMANLLHKCGFTLISSDTTEILLAPDKPFPALYVFATPSTSTPSMQKDEGLKAHIIDYIAISRQMMNEFDERLQLVLAQTPEVLVWGTGQLTLKLLAETSLANAKIVAFVDSNTIFQGMLLRGSPILAPSKVKPSTTPIIVASTLHYEDICKSIHQYGLTNPIISLRG